jgi:hypothetical protein
MKIRGFPSRPAAEATQNCCLDWPAFRFFLAKGVLLAMGFGFIAIHLFLVWVRSLLNVKF